MFKCFMILNNFTDCRRLYQSVSTREVTYSIAAVATFFLTLIINPLLGEESRFGYTYPEVVPEVQLMGPTPVLDYP